MLYRKNLEASIYDYFDQENFEMEVLFKFLHTFLNDILDNFEKGKCNHATKLIKEFDIDVDDLADLLEWVAEYIRLSEYEVI